MNHDNGVNLFAAFMLAILGELAHFIRVNHEVIGLLFQWFAWGGAGTVGAITFIRFLQDNGWIPKGKRKKNGQN